MEWMTLLASVPLFAIHQFWVSSTQHDLDRLHAAYEQWRKDINAFLNQYVHVILNASTSSDDAKNALHKGMWPYLNAARASAGSLRSLESSPFALDQVEHLHRLTDEMMGDLIHILSDMPGERTASQRLREALTSFDVWLSRTRHFKARPLRQWLGKTARRLKHWFTQSTERVDALSCDGGRKDKAGAGNLPSHPT